MKNKIIYILIILFLQNCSIFIPLRDLPKPNGKHIIGTDIIILEDKYRSETFTEEADDYRKIIVQVWYPAIEKSDSLYPYLDYKDIKTPYIAKRLEVSERIIRYFEQSRVAQGAIVLLIFLHSLELFLHLL